MRLEPPSRTSRMGGRVQSFERLRSAMSKVEDHLPRSKIHLLARHLLPFHHCLLLRPELVLPLGSLALHFLRSLLHRHSNRVRARLMLLLLDHSHSRSVRNQRGSSLRQSSLRKIDLRVQSLRVRMEKGHQFSIEGSVQCVDRMGEVIEGP